MYAKRISVDCDLGEFGSVRFEPEEEEALGTESFEGAAEDAEED